MDWRKGIKEFEVNGESVYLKKGILGWSVVYPIKDYNGKINWKNLIAGGSWIKLGIVIFAVIILIGAIFEISSIVETANGCLNNKQMLNNLVIK